LIIKLNKFADKDNYPSEWSKNMTNKLLETEREIFLQGYQKAFLLNQTCCGLCKDCSGNRIDCKDKKTQDQALRLLLLMFIKQLETQEWK
jgi:predicted metal-binding protein